MKNWYIVQTFSGFENKVAETLKDTIKTKELDDKISEVLVPIHLLFSHLILSFLQYLLEFLQPFAQNPKKFELCTSFSY